MASDKSPWGEFLLAAPWFLDPAAEVTIRPEGKLSRPPGSLFPTLSALIHTAAATQVLVNGAAFELLSWGDAAPRPMWLCDMPATSPPPGLWWQHRELLSCFGGIVDRINEPRSWLLNCNASLTLTEAANDASFMTDCSWMMKGAAWPIELAEYYSISREANGNTTLCNRSSGQVLLFAPDHAFAHVRVLEGCPDYSLYTLDRTPDFRTWVETISAQWFSAIGAAT